MRAEEEEDGLVILTVDMRKNKKTPRTTKLNKVLARPDKGGLGVESIIG